MTAYYNEIDPHAAEWLRSLIKEGKIPNGIVDTRSIEDILPSDLAGFTQCHFFCGIGGWPLALRLAGVPDDRPLWTGSCPCQPFSAAGEGKGFDDERHLWPAWFHLIRQRRPSLILGEQVASKDGLGWLDLVSADLEGSGYAIGANDLCAAGFGAVHIRQRLYFAAVAYSDGQRWGQAGCDVADQRAVGSGGVDGHGLADADCDERDRFGGTGTGRGPEPANNLATHWLEHATLIGRDERGTGATGRGVVGGCGDGGMDNPDGGDHRSGQQRLFPLHCRDGRIRFTEPGLFPLAAKLPAGMGSMSSEGRALAALAGLDAKSLRDAKNYRVEALRGYGNAIHIGTATEFIRCLLD